MGKSKLIVAINVVVTIIVSVLLLGLIGGLIVWLAREEGLTVYVDYGEKRYTVNAVDTSLGALGTNEHTFTVGSLTSEAVDYTVEITPNDKASFTFVTTDKRYKWTSVDCSKYFDVVKTDKSFTLKITDDTTLTNCLRSVYGEIQYSQVMPDSGEYFILTVKTSYGAIAMPFGLAVGDKPYASNITIELQLSTDNIVF